MMLGIPCRQSNPYPNYTPTPPLTLSNLKINQASFLFFFRYLKILILGGQDNPPPPPRKYRGLTVCLDKQLLPNAAQRGDNVGVELNVPQEREDANNIDQVICEEDALNDLLQDTEEDSADDNDEGTILPDGVDLGGEENEDEEDEDED